MILTKLQYFFWKYIKEGMLFNMQTCIILQFEQNCSFCPVPQLPQVFGCPAQLYPVWLYFSQKEPIKMKIFETFKCLGQNLSNSSYQLWNDKSVSLQILHNSSLSWQITPLWILSLYFFKFGLKDPIKIAILSAVEKICHIPHVIFQTTGQLKVMLDKSVNNVLGEGM